MKFVRVCEGRLVDLGGGRLIETAHDALERRWSVALTTVDPNQSLTRHHHQTAIELYIGMSGRGKIVVNGKVIDFGTGDFLQIDPGEHHHAMASDTAVTFIAVTLPAFDPSDFISVGHDA